MLRKLIIYAGKEFSNLKSDWDERTVLIASLIPDYVDVLEFGAGRLVLKINLPKNCTYQPCDIVDRGNNCIVCDLNQDFPKITKKYTYTVFSGVLEYIYNIEKIIKNVSRLTDYVVVSYATFDVISCYITRRRNGWVNYYKDKEFVCLFSKYGFELKKK